MAMADVRMTAAGMECIHNGTTILLDPKHAIGDINFVSHAHKDHLPSRANGVVLASENTVRLAALRGDDLGEYTMHADGIRMYDSGHILGSTGLLVGDTFYTGDICTRDRGFLKGASVPRCHTLVTECTFGLPEFQFPSLHEICSRVDELIAMLYSRGAPVVLLGYELGKAQTLSQLFAHWEPLYYHDSVKAINDMHRAAGVSLMPAMGHTEAKAAGLLARKPWLMVAPMMSHKSAFILDMKRYGAVTISFSGWANSSRFPYSRGADYFMPLSDHCDFNELVEMVRRSGARQVYTIHGFTCEFAEHLQSLGISAQPLESAGQAG